MKDFENPGGGFEGVRSDSENDWGGNVEAGWEPVEAMAGKFEESLARTNDTRQADRDWMAEVVDAKFRAMKGGIENGLNQYAEDVI